MLLTTGPRGRTFILIVQVVVFISIVNTVITVNDISFFFQESEFEITDYCITIVVLSSPHCNHRYVFLSFIFIDSNQWVPFYLGSIDVLKDKEGQNRQRGQKRAQTMPDASFGPLGMSFFFIHVFYVLTYYFYHI